MGSALYAPADPVESRGAERPRDARLQGLSRRRSERDPFEQEIELTTIAIKGERERRWVCELERQINRREDLPPPRGEEAIPSAQAGLVCRTTLTHRANLNVAGAHHRLKP